MTRRAILLVVLLLVIGVTGAAPGRAASPGGEARDPATRALIDAVTYLETDASKIQLPEHPVRALIDSTAGLSAALGFPQDPGPAIRRAGLSSIAAGHLARVVQALVDCTAVTTAHLRAMSPSQLVTAAREGAAAAGLDPGEFLDIRACAARLWGAANALREVLSMDRSADADVDLWPVFRLNTAGDSFYENDYLLQVDLVGDDVYNNNAGSNMVDLNFSPSGSRVTGLRGTGPAKGCQMAVPALLAGDCTPLAAVLLDLGGEDTYGVKQAGDVDAACTNDPVIRRMVTQGVGFLGAGILLEAGGDDTYTGKTVTQGGGHIFGVGTLADLGGDDSYTAVRNAQGFALIHALGFLRDVGGNDRYDFYLPTALDPNAPNQTPGAGGVIDDEGVCDNRIRFQQGAANTGGEGHLLNTGGNDTYIGGFSDDFQAPASPVTTGRGGSQGFGNSLGIGVFVDSLGNDSYTIVNQTGSQGAPARGNNVTIPPGQESTGIIGLFVDR